MKTLEKTFKSKQFNHNQLKRVGNFAIYERWKDDTKKHYEVVKIGRHNGYTIAGQYVAPAETYPSSSSWGMNGWTCITIEQAEEKFKQFQAEARSEKSSKQAAN